MSWAGELSQKAKAERLKKVAAFIDTVTRDDPNASHQVDLLADLIAAVMWQGSVKSGFDIEDLTAEFERNVRLKIAHLLARGEA